MKKFPLLLALGLLPLAACSFAQPGDDQSDDGAQTSSVPETKNVVYRGTLRPLGASIYMEGSHRLELEDGRFVLLESNGLLLDDYLDEEVEVFGSTRPTVENGGIIMRVERIANVVESSDASSSESSAEAMMEESSSSEAAMAPASSAAPVVRSSTAPVVVSSAPPAPVSSAAAVSSAATSSASSEDAAVAARAAAMAKVNMDASNWTQQYCTSHIGFCIPVHKNWWYTSFGATSSSLWHVELSSEAIENLGDGPLTVVLKSGAAPGPDGQVTVDGGTVTGIRAWTDNRHFEISAPAVLEQAVRHVTQELVSAPTDAGAAQ